MFVKYNDGWIEVITGPMFSGKSAELIKRAESLIYAKKDFLVFKPKLDSRSGDDTIKSRTGAVIKSIIIEEPKEMIKYIKKSTSAVIVDEVQFFNEDILETLQVIAKKKVRVIVAGLDMDFKMRPFGSMPQILSISEFVSKLKAVCFTCGRAASFSKRIRGSKNETIEIGDESYEARCRKCF